MKSLQFKCQFESTPSSFSIKVSYFRSNKRGKCWSRFNVLQTRFRDLTMKTSDVTTSSSTKLLLLIINSPGALFVSKKGLRVIKPSLRILQVKEKLLVGIQEKTEKIYGKTRPVSQIHLCTEAYLEQQNDQSRLNGGEQCEQKIKEF